MVSRVGYKDDRGPFCEGDFLTMPNIRSDSWNPVREYAMPLKVPGSGHLLEAMWDEERLRKERHKRKEVLVEDQTALENRAAFVNNGSVKAQLAQLKREVKDGLRKADEDLDEKRNKLKTAMLKEQRALIEEYAEKVKNLPRKLYEEKKKRAEEIVQRLEHEKGGEAKEKIEQLVRDNSEQLRERISIVKRLEAAEIQRHQICEKKIQMEREAEFDRYWLELQKKRDEERLKFEEEEEQLKMTLVKEQRDVLNKQILGKMMMKDEMKKVVEKEATFVDELRKKIQDEDEEARKFTQWQKNERMKMQKAELVEAQRLKEGRKQREKDFDDYFLHKLKEDIEKEKAMQIDTKAEKKREAEFFIQQLKEIRAVQREEERQIEELRAQEVLKKEEEIMKNRMALKETRDKLHRETLETWKQQLLYKKKVLDEEKAVERRYLEEARELLEVNKDLDRMAIENMKDEEKARIKDLEWQQDYEKTLKQREASETRARSDAAAQKELQTQELIQSFGSCFGPPHPFARAIYENQPSLSK